MFNDILSYDISTGLLLKILPGLSLSQQQSSLNQPWCFTMSLKNNFQFNLPRAMRCWLIGSLSVSAVSIDAGEINTVMALVK